MRAKVFIAGCALLVIVGVAVYRHSQRSVPAVTPKPSEQVSAPSLPKPRLPAPQMPVAPPPAESESDSTPSTNLIARLMSSDFPRLSAEQVEPYLQKHHRSAESLLGAFAATGDRAYLREALERNPNDPCLNLTAYYQGDAWAAEVSAGGQDRNRPASPERRQLLDALAKAAPDNAMANYLLALDCFKSGQSDQAVEQLIAASQKSKFKDYLVDAMQNTEEAYRAAGYSEGEAKAIAAATWPLHHLTELRQTGHKLIELAALYRQAGDEASAQAVEQIGLGLGQRLTQPGSLPIIQQLVGIGIEQKILGAMDPNRALDGTGQTVQSWLDALNQQKQAIKSVVRASDILPTLSDPDLAGYFDRVKLFGETAAAEWLLKTHGK